MISSKAKPTDALATAVSVDDDALTVELSDGRALTVPLAWFPRLTHGTAKERSNWEFIGRGRGIHWPELDEDISVENLLLGNPSCESQRSFQKWLAGRGQRRNGARRAGAKR